MKQQIPSKIKRPRPKPRFDKKGDTTKSARPKPHKRHKPLP